MRDICLSFFLVGLGLLWAGEPTPDTSYGKWTIDKEDSTALSRTTTQDGWYRILIVVPPDAKTGDTLLDAKVLIGQKGVFLPQKESAENIRRDLDQLNGLLEQIKQRLDSTGGPP